MRSHYGFISAFALAVMTLMVRPAAGHHSMSEFDREVFTEVEGVISRLAWKNPHILLEIKTTGAAGTPLTWTLEGGAVSAVSRRGVNGDQFKIGDRVRVAGNPSTRRDHYMQVHHIMTAAGAELLVGNIRTPRWTAKPLGTTAAIDTGAQASPSVTPFSVSGARAPEPGSLPVRVPVISLIVQRLPRSPDGMTLLTIR